MQILNKQINVVMQKSPNEKKQYEKDIHERIYQFVIRVINLTKVLPKNPQNDVVIYQLVKSATSMGANDQEADGAESKKDFIAKYSIVKKETNMKLQELVNKLSNLLAGGAGEADVKIDDKDAQTVSLVDIDGVQKVVIN